MPSSATRRLERRERLQEQVRPPAIEDRADEPLDRRLVLLVRAQPAGVDLRLAQRLRHVGDDAIAKGRLRAGVGLERPRADQRLIEQVLLVRVRRQRAADLGLEAAVHRPPARDARLSTRPASPTARSAARARPRRAWCRASTSPTAPTAIAAAAPPSSRARRPARGRSGSDRRRPRSATAAGCRRRAPCPRCPWRRPGS